MESHEPDPTNESQPNQSGSGTASKTESRPPIVMAEPREHDEVASNPLGLLVIAGLFGLLWWAGPRYFVVVSAIVVMIFLHEVGHFVTAKMTGMKVTQFFLFMGPRIWSFRRGEVEYGLRMLPIGAFVRIVGMNNLDPPEPEDVPRAYMNKSFPKKMLVITAGSMMHFVQAILLFMVVTSVIGFNDPNRWSIGEISQLETGEVPAADAGLEPGDTIVSIDGVSSTNWNDLRAYVQDRPGEQVTLEVQAPDGAVRQATTTLASVDGELFDEDTEEMVPVTVGFIGIAANQEKTPESPLAAFEEFGNTMTQTLKAIPLFVNPSTYLDLANSMAQGRGQVDFDDDEAQRPVSMVGIVRFAGQPDADWSGPIYLLAVVNVFVGVLNLMPLLPLDGGHAVIAIYERIRSRNGKRYQMDVAKLLPVTYGVVAVLGFLMISTVYLDIFRPISGG